MSRMLCFRPTRKVHDSGFRYIEYGYINDVDEVEIIGQYDILQTPYDQMLPYNLDLTKSGWFRILPRRDLELEWEYGGTIAIKALHRTQSDTNLVSEGE